MTEPTHPHCPPVAVRAGLAVALGVGALWLAGAGAAPARAADPGGLAAPSGGGGLPTRPVAGPAPAPAAKKVKRPVPRRAARRPTPAPVVTEAACLGACTAGRHAVPLGGLLVVHGHHIAKGMVVLFASKAVAASVHPTTAAQIRLSRKGFIVTVPANARTGRIVVQAAAGVRSRPFGPIRVFGSPPAVRSPVPATPAPPGSPFEGLGQWIWYVAKSEGGNLDAIAARAHTAGVRTVFVKSSDGSTNFWAQFTPDLVAALHQRGLRVCAWQYVYGTHPAEEAQLGARAAAMADC